jgi:hypothetical protein
MISRSDTDDDVIFETKMGYLLPQGAPLLGEVLGIKSLFITLSGTHSPGFQVGEFMGDPKIYC